MDRQTVIPTERATAATNEVPRRFRTEKQLRDTVSMLAHCMWYGKPRPGDHVWSIPVDQERDFDCILSDAIDELVELRAVAKAREAGCSSVVPTLPDGETTDLISQTTEPKA